MSHFTPHVGWENPRPADFSPPAVNSPHPLHVLIVDDELLIRWSIAETLTAHGYQVMEAGDAASALHILDDIAPPPDVVLLDHRLPDSDDLRLLATVRRKAPHTPIILMTAFGTPEVVKRALELGACAVVSKPFEVDDLVPLVSGAHLAAR